LIALALDEKLLAELDAKRGALTRSAYVRLAITNMLGLPAELARPPAREGLSKGGKPTHKKKKADLAPLPAPAAEKVKRVSR
jgi:hypothetical protein